MLRVFFDHDSLRVGGPTFQVLSQFVSCSTGLEIAHRFYLYKSNSISRFHYALV